jgi:hypothetical protein
MIHVGQKKEARYWGKFEVKKVARLKKAVACQCEDIGAALFEPTIVQIEWEKPPSGDKNEYWFPYWITIGGKEKYGQFAPMIGEKALLGLLEDAVQQDFFSESFLRGLSRVMKQKLGGE